jgi:hypothetical protein
MKAGKREALEYYAASGMACPDEEGSSEAFHRPKGSVGKGLLVSPDGANCNAHLHDQVAI